MEGYITRRAQSGDLVGETYDKGRWIPVTDITVKMVCAPCNNGWMSGLERAAMPVLSPIIEGQPVGLLSREQASVMATWAAKTALMYQFNDRRLRVSTGEQVRSLKGSLLPPDLTSVWAGRYCGERWNMNLHQDVFGMSPTGHGPPPDMNLSRVTLVLGHLVLQVHTSSWIAVEQMDAMLRRLSPGVRVWPGPADVSWSTLGSMDDQDVLATFLRPVAD